MLTLHTANRYEELRERLLDNLAASTPTDPFASPQIIVPSMAIKRDVQLAIAQHRGVCTRIEFPFLAQWLWSCFGKLVDVPEISPFSPQRLTWRLLRIFMDATFIAEHPRLQQFLRQADPVMPLELAQRVAALFDQNVTYRPAWLEAWRDGKSAKLPAQANRQDESWQAALWRRITAELGTQRQHPAKTFLTALSTLDHLPQGTLPDSVDLFALQSLPPLYLDLLNALSEHMDLRLYQLNPCAEFWFDVVNPKRMARLRAAKQDDFHEIGNPLLAAWGQQTQAQLSLLFDCDALVESTADIVEHPSDTLLGQIQNAILHLQESPETTTLNRQDRSLEIHVCHSLTRELEALHDRLLALHASLPDLRADEILVAVPDLENAAPLIEAVFGARGGLPFHITGRSEAKHNQIAKTLLAIMDAASSRLPASEGIALLRNPLIARRFLLAEPDIEILVDALHRAGLHWGSGSEQKHSWRSALSRLLLGYATGTPESAQPETPFLGELPIGSGQHSRVLGLLWRFLEALEALRTQLRSPSTVGQTASDWRAIWHGMLDAFMQPTDKELEDARQVRQLITELTTHMTEGDRPEHPECFSLELARAALTQALETAPRGAIPSGSITFAALPSLRGLPYRIICLIGLNDGVFPSPQRPLEFDLLAQDYQPGDRQRRQDERNLFLDLLLAARQFLHISYTGRHQRDDSPMPPSVLIAELLDHLRPNISQEGIERLHVRHPLQPFSPRYLQPESDPRLVCFTSFSAILPPQADRTRVFFDQPLPSLVAADYPDTLDLSPSLSDLKAFFRHPARAVLRNRLGIQLASENSDIADDEPLLMTQPDTWPLADRLLPMLLTPETPLTADELTDYALAGIEVPVGAIGKAQLNPLLTHLTQFAEAIRSRRDAPGNAPLPPVQTLLSAPLSTDPGHPHPQPTLRLSMPLQLRDIRPQGLLRYRFAPFSAGDAIAAWLDHLALCVLAPGHSSPVALRTEHLGRDATGNPLSFLFSPVEDPVPLLQDWLQAYWYGLHSPLVFPPKTAWALQREGLSAAQTAWFNRYEARGEGLDPWWQLAFRGQLPRNHNLFNSPLAEALHHWSNTLLGPLLTHLEEPA